MQVTFSILVAVTLILIAILIALIFYSLDLRKSCRKLFESNKRIIKENDQLIKDLSKYMEELHLSCDDAVYWEDKYKKLKIQCESVQKDKPMFIEVAHKIDHIHSCISIPRTLAENIETMDDNDLVNLENSMEKYIKEAVINDLLYYCNYEVSYDAFSGSYSFFIDIPVARKTDMESEYKQAERFYPMVDIFKGLTKEVGGK